MAVFGSPLQSKSKDPTTNDDALLSFRETSNQRFRAVCFSHNRASLPMWAYYCSDKKTQEAHTGLVIEFDETDSEFRAKFRRDLREVDYVRARPRVTELQANDLPMLYAKAADWAHEWEVRLVQSMSDDRMSEGNVGGKKAWFLPFPKSSVAAIYFGLNMDEERKREIADNVANWGYNQVRLVEMHPHPDRFELVERTYVPKQPVEYRPKAPAHQIDENSTPAEVMAHIIERIISKRGAPDSCKDKSLAPLLEWALAEVKNIPTQIPWLESLYVDTATERILVRDEPS